MFLVIIHLRFTFFIGCFACQAPMVRNDQELSGRKLCKKNSAGRFVRTLLYKQILFNQNFQRTIWCEHYGLSAECQNYPRQEYAAIYW